MITLANRKLIESIFNECGYDGVISYFSNLHKELGLKSLATKDWWLFDHNYDCVISGVNDNLVVKLT